MAVDLDQLPYYDPLVKGTKMSDVWIAAMSSLIQTLQGYLSQNGMFMPRVSNAERALIQSPVNGQLIYNTDTDTAEYFKAGVWTPF